MTLPRYRAARALLASGLLVATAGLLWHLAIRHRLPDGYHRITGRVSDGQQGLAGVRVYPDRLRHLTPLAPTPVATTDDQGRFQLDLLASDEVLAVEKDGWQRDLVPAGAWAAPILLHPEPAFHTEAVVLVRLDFEDEAAKVSDAELRTRLFSREPGVASAANYLYEVSKGALLLVEGRLHQFQTDAFPPPRHDAQKAAMARWVLERLRGQAWGDCDRVDNRTGDPAPDGKPDHLWIFTPGHPQSVTADEADLKAVSLLLPLPWDPATRWPLLFLSEEVPLGNIVHEAFHAMGEHRVDDLYLERGGTLTAGIWGLMDGGQYRGWDRSHPKAGPWVEDTGYSPSQPMAWVRSVALVLGTLPPHRATCRGGRLHLGRLAGADLPGPGCRSPVAHGGGSPKGRPLFQPGSAPALGLRPGPHREPLRRGVRRSGGRPRRSRPPQLWRSKGPHAGRGCPPRHRRAAQAPPAPGPLGAGRRRLQPGAGGDLPRQRRAPDLGRAGNRRAWADAHPGHPQPISPPMLQLRQRSLLNGFAYDAYDELGERVGQVEWPWLAQARNARLPWHGTDSTPGEIALRYLGTTCRIGWEFTRRGYTSDLRFVLDGPEGRLAMADLLHRPGLRRPQLLLREPFEARLVRALRPHRP